MSADPWVVIQPASDSEKPSSAIQSRMMSLATGMVTLYPAEPAYSKHGPHAPSKSARSNASTSQSPLRSAAQVVAGSPGSQGSGQGPQLPSSWARSNAFTEPSPSKSANNCSTTRLPVMLNNPKQPLVQYAV